MKCVGVLQMIERPLNLTVIITNAHNNSMYIPLRQCCCDFFERVGEKRIDVGTLLAFLFFSVSDGVLCFCLMFFVIFLALAHLQVCMCAYRRIDRAISGQIHGIAMSPFIISEQVLARWRCLVAFMKAMDLPHRAMRAV